MIYKKTVKELLGESVHELAKKSDLDKVTVKQIAENCRISTVTFYKYFRDKYDLIAWIYTYQMEEIFADFDDGMISWAQTLTALFSIVQEDKSFYGNANKNVVGQNGFSESTAAKLYELFTGSVKKKYSAEVDGEMDFYIKFYLGGITACFFDWFGGGCVGDIGVIVERLCELAPQFLVPYLF